jgi:hypothetical protein
MIRANRGLLSIMRRGVCSGQYLKEEYLKEDESPRWLGERTGAHGWIRKFRNSGTLFHSAFALELTAFSQCCRLSHI